MKLYDAWFTRQGRGPWKLVALTADNQYSTIVINSQQPAKYVTNHSIPAEDELQAVAKITRALKEGLVRLLDSKSPTEEVLLLDGKEVKRENTI